MSPSPVLAKKEWFSLQKGWRAGISRGIVLISLVFIVNLVCTFYALSKSSRGIGYGQKIIFEGNCQKVKRLETYWHLVINILSTIILGASNYTMQCLSAPTRQEVDKAHRQGIWLDIGILSFHNLSEINGKRTWLWALLGLSSVPLHLFYNSAIYASTFSADYIVFMTTESYLLSNATSHTLGIDTAMTTSGDPAIPSFNDLWQGRVTSDNISIADLSSTLYTSAVTNTLIHYNTSECMSFYATQFPTSQGSLILVTSDAANTPRMLGYSCMRPLTDLNDNCLPDPSDWICDEIPRDGGCNHLQPCSVLRSQLDPNNWRPLGNKVDYCLSQHLDEKRILALNLPVIMVVLAFNILKIGLLVLTLWSINDSPLMTVGDAIASFIREKDDTTQGMCLMNRNDLDEWRKCFLHAGPCTPKHVNISKRKWNSVVGTSRWVGVLSLYTVMLGICTSLFLRGILSPVTPAAMLMKLPLGDADPMTFIVGWGIPSEGVTGLLSNIFVANSPQLLLSMIYFTYNSLFTTFLLGAEWNSFSSRRKGLRVSEHPTGSQRATHFLQLPFRWAIPLMALSAILHWLCSQSIFLVSIEFYHRNDSFRLSDGTTFFDCATEPTDYDDDNCFGQHFTCGYSPIGILLTTILGITMVVVAVLTGLKRYNDGSMPIAGSCSAAISASCHILDEDRDEPEQENKIGGQAAVSRLQWGEVDMRLISVNDVHAAVDESEVHADASEIVYHCGFSHHEVSVPDGTKLYA